MAMKFGVNTWVWVSPLTTADVEKLVPMVKGMGFDSFLKKPFQVRQVVEAIEAATNIAA